MPALDHPSPADLQAFAIGALSEDQARSVESHLAECPTCLAVAAAAPDDTLVTLLRSAETSQAGPVTPGPAFAETIGLSQSGTSAESVPGPPELAHHTRYRLIRPLGRGGMGHVWLAEHTLMGRTVALKIIRPEFLDKPDAVERFRREVRAAARLKHPNIVAAHDADQAGGLHFLVMEYIAGETLAERIAAGPVPVPDACRWVIDAARGLEHARENGLIHRDVKPHNLILERPTGRVKVLDFGLAGVATGESTGLTGGNVVIGTPDYISPEQAEDPRTADTRSDVYSLGCTLYHLLAGRPPFPADGVVKKIDAHRHAAPEPLTVIRQDMTPALAELVARMLAKDPSERPQTPGEVAVALEEILAGRGGEPPMPARRRRGDGGGGRRFRDVAAVALVLLAGAAVVAYKVSRKLTDEGTLIVQNASSDDVWVIIKRDGTTVRTIDPRTSVSAVLPAGNYDIYHSGSDEFRVTPSRVELRRGDHITVRLERVSAAPPERLVSVAGLRPLGPAEPADAGWAAQIPLADLLAATEVGRVTSDDRAPWPAVEVTNTSEANARIRLPFRPTSSYEVRATITRVAGDDAFVLVLPLPGGPGPNPHVALVVDIPISGRGRTHLYHQAGGEPARVAMSEAFGGRLERGRSYSLYVRVVVAGDKAAVRAELDNKVLIDWSGQQAEFRSGPYWEAKDNSRLAFGVLRGAFRVERIESRLLPGTGPQTPTAPVTLHGKPDAPWTDLVPFVDMTADKESGSLVRENHDGRPVLRVKDPGGFARVRLPFVPVSGDYEVRARITRVEGNDSFNLMLPLPASGGRTQVGLYLDGFPQPRDGHAGLEWAGGPKVSMVKFFESRLKNGQPYDVLAHVSAARGRVRISLAVDNKTLFDWQGPVNDAKSGVNFFTNDRRYVGFGTCASTYRVERFEVRMLSGTGQLTRPDQAPPAKSPEGPLELPGDPDAPWVNLLDGLGLPAGVVDGTWGWSGEVQKVSLLADDPKGKGGRFALPVWPKGDYELRLRFARTNPEGHLVVMLPVSGGPQLALSVGGGVGPEVVSSARLEVVPGERVETPLKDALGHGLADGTTYTLFARLTTKDGRVAVRAEIDGKKLVDWSWAVPKAPPSPTWFTPDRGQLGLGVGGNGQFRFEAIEFRPLSGKAVWKPERAAAPKRATEKPGQVGRFGRYRGAVIQIDLSADGKHLFAGEDGVSKWDVDSRQILWANDGPAGAIPALSGDGKVLLVCDHDGFARVLDPADGKEKRKFPIPPQPVAHAIVNKDGTRAFISQRGLEAGAKPVVRAWLDALLPAPWGQVVENEARPAIRAWDVVNGKELFRLDGHTDDCYGLALSADGSRLATVSYDKSVRVWLAATGKREYEFTGHKAGVSSVAFSADGKYLVTAGGDNQVRVWGLQEKRCVSLMSGHTEWITDAAFTPDGTRVVSVSGYEGRGDGVRVWDWRTGDELEHFARSRGAIGSVAITPDGRTALTGEHSGEVRVWRLPGPPQPKPETVGPVRRFGRFLGAASDVSVSKDGKFVYGVDGVVTRWDLAAGKALWSQSWADAPAMVVAASPDGRHVVVGFENGLVRVVDAQTGREMTRFTGHPNNVGHVAVSPDGQRAVSCGATKEKAPKPSVWVWEVETGKPLFELKGHTGPTWGATFSKDGDRIATASDDGTVRVWDAADGKGLAVLNGHKGNASTVAFSPDGKRVVSGGQDLTVRVWDLARKEQVLLLEGHDVWVTEVAYTPDGNRIVSVSSNFDPDAHDGPRVWDAVTGKALYEGKPGIPAVGLAVLPDSRYAVTGGTDGAIRVWKLPDPPGPPGKQ